MPIQSKDVGHALSLGTREPWVTAAMMAPLLGLGTYYAAPSIMRASGNKSPQHVLDRKAKKMGIGLGALPLLAMGGVTAYPWLRDTMGMPKNEHLYNGATKPWNRTRIDGITEITDPKPAPVAKTAGFISAGQAMQNVQGQEYINPSLKLQMGNVIRAEAQDDPRSLINLGDVAKGMIGYGIGSGAATMLSSMLGLSNSTQARLQTVGGWGGALLGSGALNKTNLVDVIGPVGTMKLLGF